MRVRWAASILSALVLAVQDRPTSFAAVQSEMDWSAILRTWRIKGVLACPKPCVWVENAYPVGLFEVTRQPMRTDIAEFKPLLKPFAGGTSSHTASSDRTDSTLQFAEAHVYEYVPMLELGLMARPSPGPAALSYLSEIDRWGWRDPALDWFLHPAESGIVCEGAKLPLRACAGTWGNYYPRHGFLTRDSEVIAAYVQGLRGGRIASEPAMHVILKPYAYEPRTGHYIQMIAPVRRSAIRIGELDAATVESGAGARDGTYRFVHFGIFEACRRCIPPRLVSERAP